MDKKNTSSNPAFRNVGKVVEEQQAAAPSTAMLYDMYNQPAYTPPATAETRFLTLDDVITKTATVLGVGILSALATIWFMFNSSVNVWALVVPAMLVGLVLSLVIIFKGSSNPGLILAYSLAEGVMLGGITGVFESIPQYEGIGIQALAGTMGVFVGMLVVYKTGAIRVTPKFTRWVIGALVGALVLSLANFVAYFFMSDGLGLRSGGPLAIVFSLVMIGIAAFMLLLDFDMADEAIRRGAPAKFAWYVAFGLLVTVVWLYMEILRLLSYFRE